MSRNRDASFSLNLTLQISDPDVRNARCCKIVVVTEKHWDQKIKIDTCFMIP